MDDREQEQIKRWSETWKRAGPMLEAVRARQLRDFRYEDHMHEIDQLLQLACRFARPRPISGLVEQQRLFQRARDLLSKRPS